MTGFERSKSQGNTGLKEAFKTDEEKVLEEETSENVVIENVNCGHIAEDTGNFFLHAFQKAQVRKITFF